MTRSLKALQICFQNYVLGPAEEASPLYDEVQTGHGLSVEKRLRIYHDAYRIRLRDALSDAFEKTHSYLGDELFFEAASGYVDAHPSSFQNLRWYGADFPDHLLRTLPEHPIVAELAKFEWALGLAFDALDTPLLNAAALQNVAAEDWERLGFLLHPSVQLVPMRWNAVAIWQALDKDEIPPDAAPAELTACWLIWRKALQPHFRSLTQHEAGALAGLQQRLSFSAVCERAAVDAENEEDITRQIGSWLHIWLQEELLTGIHYG